jgi:hypothetical protein
MTDFEKELIPGTGIKLKDSVWVLSKIKPECIEMIVLGVSLIINKGVPEYYLLLDKKQSLGEETPLYEIDSDKLIRYVLDEVFTSLMAAKAHFMDIIYDEIKMKYYRCFKKEIELKIEIFE